jgi:hypothetical protein
MTDYVKSTNFTSKDSLASGNPLKIIKGAEFDTEFNNIATAVSTKADLNSPTFIGTVTIPSLTMTNAVTVANGGTGATTAAAARANLGVSASGVLTSSWTVTESGGVIYFAYGGTNKAKLDSSGNLTVVGNVTAYGTV